MKIKTMTRFITTTLITIVLSGCASQTTQAPTKTYQPTSSRQASLLSRVEKTGAQVITQGQRLWVVIPTDEFFENQTTQVKSSKRKDVGTIAQFILNYNTKHPRAMVYVSGYTNESYGHQSAKRISGIYASVVGSYLWNYGISRHNLTIVGYGTENPIASTTTTPGRGYNRRVMIAIN